MPMYLQRRLDSSLIFQWVHCMDVELVLMEPLPVGEVTSMENRVFLLGLHRSGTSYEFINQEKQDSSCFSCMHIQRINC